MTHQYDTNNDVTTRQTRSRTGKIANVKYFVLHHKIIAFLLTQNIGFAIIIQNNTFNCVKK
jgi:hypothetical protein